MLENSQESRATFTRMMERLPMLAPTSIREASTPTSMAITY
jgi:hypothetical protein